MPISDEYWESLNPDISFSELKKELKELTDYEFTKTQLPKDERLSECKEKHTFDSLVQVKLEKIIKIGTIRNV